MEDKEKTVIGLLRRAKAIEQDIADIINSCDPNFQLTRKKQEQIIRLDKKIELKLSEYREEKNIYERSCKLSKADRIATRMAVFTGWWDDEVNSVRARNAVVKDREAHNAYHRKYRAEHKERINEIKRDSRMKIYRSNAIQRLKDSANGAIKRMISLGRLKRKSCEICGDPAQAHHDSYLKEDILKVRFLCIFHHSEWHRLNEPKVPKL